MAGNGFCNILFANLFFTKNLSVNLMVFSCIVSEEVSHFNAGGAALPTTPPLLMTE